MSSNNSINSVTHQLNNLSLESDPWVSYNQSWTPQYWGEEPPINPLCQKHTWASSATAYVQNESLGWCHHCYGWASNAIEWQINQAPPGPDN